MLLVMNISDWLIDFWLINVQRQILWTRTRSTISDKGIRRAQHDTTTASRQGCPPVLILLQTSLT